MIKPLFWKYLIKKKLTVFEFFYMDSVYNFTKFFFEIKDEDIDFLSNMLSVKLLNKRII